MKRVNWKRWLVVGLSCSLFMDSVVGVTVLAETIAGETEQGVATSQSSDEASQTTQTTEESQATVASEAKTVPPQETARIAARAIGYSSVEGREIPFFFVEEDGTLFDPDRITMAVNLSSFSFYEEKLQRTPLEPTTVNGGKLLSIPTSPAFNMIQITRIQVIFMAFLKCRLLFLRSIKAWTFDQVRFIQETLRNIQCQRFLRTLGAK